MKKRIAVFVFLLFIMFGTIDFALSEISIDLSTASLEELQTAQAAISSRIKEIMNQTATDVLETIVTARQLESYLFEKYPEIVEYSLSDDDGSGKYFLFFRAESNDFSSGPACAKYASRMLNEIKKMPIGQDIDLVRPTFVCLIGFEIYTCTNINFLDSSDFVPSDFDFAQ